MTYVLPGVRLHAENCRFAPVQVTVPVALHILCAAAGIAQMASSPRGMPQAARCFRRVRTPPTNWVFIGFIVKDFY
jgi:hypothetical protein